MIRSLLLACSFALTGCGETATGQEPAAGPEEAQVSNFKKVTPVLLAGDVGACVTFWEALGLTATMTVPHDDGLGFAALASGDVELMYQSFAMSRAQDTAAIEGIERAIVYLEVRSLEDVLAKLAETEIVVPVRETGHGTRELYVRDPAGNLIGFAETLDGAG
jgi:uncharacterized glyoxalase superfamily protein PhnB